LSHIIIVIVVVTVVIVRLSRRSTKSVFVVIVIIIIEGLKPAPASRNGQANITDISERDTEHKSQGWET
jgi:hypothetical protein